MRAREGKGGFRWRKGDDTGGETKLENVTNNFKRVFLSQRGDSAADVRKATQPLQLYKAPASRQR